MAATIQLSENDSAVLGALFDPEASLSNSVKIDPAIPSESGMAGFRKIQEQEHAALLPINVERPSLNDIDIAISKLNLIVESCPRYASAWNNRAQATRMKYEIENLPDHPDALRSIANDLAQAIRLTTPASPAAAVPEVDAKVLASAHTHRAYLFLAASRSEKLAKAVMKSFEGLGQLDREQLEETASREFALGGRYGNEIARQLGVKTNPYAKLCGSIVREAMQKEIADHSRDTARIV